MSINRIQRLNTLLQRELGELFEVYVRPALPGVLATVTGVEVASTLRNANVYVSVYGPRGCQAKALDVIARKRTLIQGDLGKRIILKYTPVLNFKLDDTAERADRVEKILMELDIPADAAEATEKSSEEPQD